MGRTKSHDDLLEAFAGEDCALCRLGLAAVHRYIEAVNYESVGDPGVREQLRAALGFCNVHAYQWLSHAHVLGTADIYVDVLTQIHAELKAMSFRRETFLNGVTSLLGQDSTRRLSPHRICPACQVLADTEAMLLRVLLATLPEPAFHQAYVASAGLCLPHLRRALAQADDPAVFATLRDTAIAHEQALLRELGAIIRRFDYRFKDEPAGTEAGAAGRAIQHVVGASGLPCP